MERKRGEIPGVIMLDEFGNTGNKKTAEYMYEEAEHYKKSLDEQMAVFTNPSTDPAFRSAPVEAQIRAAEIYSSMTAPILGQYRVTTDYYKMAFDHLMNYVSELESMLKGDKI